MAARGSRRHRRHNGNIGIIAVDDQGAQLEDVLGAVGGPPGACNAEPVFDDESAGALDHAGGDRPAFLQGLVVAHVLVVVREVGDGPVDVGEVEVALAGVSAGFRGDGGEGGGDGLRAAVQDPQQLPVGPLPGGDGVAGVEGGGGLAEVAADVDVIDQDGDLQAAFRGLGLDGGDLLPVPVHEEDPLPDTFWVAAVSLVERRPDHRGNVAGDGGGYPFVPGGRAGVRLAAGGRGGDVLRLPDGGGEVGDGDDLGHLLDPRVHGIALPRALAVLRAQGYALAVGLHHDHVAVREVVVRVTGALLVEVAGPGGKVVREPGELGTADAHPGAGLDDLLGLPEPASGQVIRHQGPHSQGVRVIGEDPPGVSRIQVRLAAVPVGHPADPDRPEHARHAPLVPGFDAAVRDPRGARDPPGPLLAGSVDRERGLQQPPLQLPALLPDHLLPLPEIAEPRLVRRPGRQPGELLRGPGQRRRHLTVRRDLAPVLHDLPHRHREPHCHRRASGFLPGMIPAHDPGNGPETGGPGSTEPSWRHPRQTTVTAVDQHRSPSVMPGTPAKEQTLQTSGDSG